MNLAPEYLIYRKEYSLYYLSLLTSTFFAKNISVIYTETIFSLSHSVKLS